MQHSEILAKFLRYYPTHICDITHWRPTSKNTIRITFVDNAEMVFTYIDENSWFLKPARKNKECGRFEKLFE